MQRHSPHQDEDATPRRRGRPPQKQLNATALGQNLRGLRLSRRLSQHALAAEAHISRATIASLELGRRTGTDTRTLKALAEALGVDPGLLLLTEGDETLGRALMGEFMDSRWARAVRTTPAEERWLLGLPFAVWQGVTPTPQAVAELLAWRRRHRRRGD